MQIKWTHEASSYVSTDYLLSISQYQIIIIIIKHAVVFYQLVELTLISDSISCSIALFRKMQS